MLRKLFGREKWGKKNFETLLQNLSDGIFVQDRDGKILYVNNAFAQIFGFDSASRVLRFKNSKTLFSQFKVRDEEGYTVKHGSMPGRTVFSGQKEPRLIVQLKKDSKGKEIWVRIRANAVKDEDGRVKYSVGIFRDITERKLIEQEDTIRRTLLEAQGKASTQGILAVDKNENVIYVNTRLAQILDVPQEKIENKTVKHLFEIGNKNIKDFDKFVNKAKLLGKSKTRKGKGVLMMKNGRVINYYTVVIENKKMEFLARLWFFDNKTSEYKIEEQRNNFINIATHELKTPLTTIRGYAEILRKKVDEKDFRKSKKYLNKIIDSTDKVTELVNDLLDINQVRQGSLSFKKVEFNIDELINDVLEGFKRSATHKLHKVGKAKNKVFADKTRIRQVLINLIGNAIKYSSENTTIRVFVKQDSTDTLISVRDFGPGIGDKDKDKIFRIYVRGKGKSKAAGLGIGLFVAQSIVKGHGGKIWVESKVGYGSNFTFTIPAKDTTKKQTGIFSLFK